jgi:hypothetical protein
MTVYSRKIMGLSAVLLLAGAATVALAQTAAPTPPAATPMVPPATTTPVAPSAATPAAPVATPAAPTAPAATNPAAPAAPAAATPAPATPAAPATPDAASPEDGADSGQTPPDASATEGQPPADDEMSLGEIPEIQTIEMTADTARKALDAYLLVKEKYKDADLENYENLQDFVDQNAQGKAFEADIKGFGFANVNDWNLAITTLVFTYTNVVDDQTEDIRQQIEDIKSDTELAQDMKDRMITSLTAMIPSENNRKVVEELVKDPAYAEKVKQLETEGE